MFWKSRTSRTESLIRMTSGCRSTHSCSAWPDCHPSPSASAGIGGVLVASTSSTAARWIRCCSGAIWTFYTVVGNIVTTPGDSSDDPLSAPSCPVGGSTPRTYSPPGDAGPPSSASTYSSMMSSKDSPSSLSCILPLLSAPPVPATPGLRHSPASGVWDQRFFSRHVPLTSEHAEPRV